MDRKTIWFVLDHDFFENALPDIPWMGEFGVLNRAIEIAAKNPTATDEVRLEKYQKAARRIQEVLHLA